MELKQQAIYEYLEQSIGYRTLAKKCGVSRTNINK
jgi:transposase-like protein